jgi:hypothetical protein
MAQWKPNEDWNFGTQKVGSSTIVQGGTLSKQICDLDTIHESMG